MKIIRLIIIGIILNLIYNPIRSQSSSFGNEERTIIMGKVINIEKDIEHKTIRFIFHNLLTGLQDSYYAIFDDEDVFRFELSIAYPQDFYLSYGTLTRLFCSPGDSLYLIVDVNERPIVRSMYGTAADINNNIQKFLSSLPNEKYIYGNATEAEKNKTPDEYTDYINQRQNEYFEYLNNFIFENKGSELFQKWAEDFIKYGSWNDLMRYRWIHPHHNRVDRSNFRLPDSYFSFLNDIDVNDFEIISLHQANFLLELSMYSLEVPVDSVKKAQKFAQENDLIAVYKIFKSMINLNTSGITRDLLLTKMYIGLLNAHQIELFDNIYDPLFTDNTFFLNAINNEYEKLKIYLSHQEPQGANIQTLSTDITKDLIKLLTEKYSDKVIYIGFWAPWCGPCMGEMPYSKEIQEHFTNDDVIFLYLANRCTEESWKATIANRNLSGEHILLTNDQYNILSALLNFSGIPHYSIIDKKGNIVLKNAPRPSAKDQLIMEINKHLRK